MEILNVAVAVDKIGKLGWGVMAENFEQHHLQGITHCSREARSEKGDTRNLCHEEAAKKVPLER